MATTWIRWCDTGTTSTITNTSSTCWDTWCNTTTSTATSSATSNNTVWYSWVGNDYTATTTDNGIWNTWAGTATYSNIVLTPAREPTAEERVEHARQQEECAKKYAEQEKQRKLAEAKAIELLHANISQRQREALEKNGWFLVEGGKSKKQYRLHNNGRMEEMEGDAAVASFCVHADYTIPIPDQVLAKALCIRLDEEWILKTANKTPLRRAA